MMRRDKCINALQKHGPLSTTGLAEKTGLHRNQINCAISESRRAFGTKHFIIVGHEAKHLPGQHGEQNIYGLGPGKDFNEPEENPHRERMADRSLSPFERIFGKG